MGYEYREVKCLKCGHVFMWNKFSEQVYYIHRLKDTGEYIGTAKCPKCGQEMLALPHILVGIEFSDDRVEIVSFKGL